MFNVLKDEEKSLATQLVGVYGPRHIFEGNPTYIYEKGARLNATGTRMESFIPDENLSAKEFEEKWTLSYLTLDHYSKSKREGSERKEILKTAKRYGHISGTTAKKNPYSAEIGLYTMPMTLECFYDPESGEFLDPVESHKLLERMLMPGVNESWAHEWEEGDLVIFDNLKVMHSTEKFLEES